MTVQISSAPVAAPFSAANPSTLNGYTSGGLGGRAAFLPIGSVDVGKVTRFDVRLTKSIPIKERYKAMFTFDAFNLFNHRYFTSVSARAYVATAAVVRTATGAGFRAFRIVFSGAVTRITESEPSLFGTLGATMHFTPKAE